MKRDVLIDLISVIGFKTGMTWFEASLSPMKKKNKTNEAVEQTTCKMDHNRQQ
jgi:hypothetical protein